MQGNTTEIDERNLLRLDALLSHGYGLSPQLVMRSKGLSSTRVNAANSRPSLKTSTTSCLNSLSLRQRPSRCVTSVLSQVPSPSLTIRATSTSSLVSWISI